jgi:transcriptional regulator with XRE-family HTH domain
MIILTPETCRAARGLLNWSADQLSIAAGIGMATVLRFERGAVSTNQSTLEMMRKALERAGVEFIEQDGEVTGVQLRQ